MGQPKIFRFERFGVMIKRGEPEPMRWLHSHTAVEFNLVVRGLLTYRFGGDEVRFRPGRLHVFGGLTPHELHHVAPGSIYYCMTVPVATVIRWRLPDNLTEPLLTGEILTDRDPANDRRRFDRWFEDLQGGDPRRTRITLPEVHARLERMALSPNLGVAWRRSGERKARGEATGMIDKVEVMLHRIAENFSSRLTLQDMAAHTGWHPRHAATQFRRLLGVPPGEFLLQQRIAHAQYLLATTSAKVIAISEECGFSTQSSFYDAFTRLTGQAPGSYRKAALKDASGPRRKPAAR